MPISDIDICNLALTKLGQQPITSFTDNTTRSAIMGRNYAPLRDKLQRKRWNFNRVYANQPALSTAPPFEYQYAYPLPDDYLRLELAAQVQPNGAPPPGQVPFGPPISIVGMPGVDLSDYNNSRSQDYRIVGKQIWSNIPPPLSIIYGARVTDPNMFDANFVETLATYLAFELCEVITNSNAKKAALGQDYKEELFEALNAKAIELPPEHIPDDTWVLSRISS